MSSGAEGAPRETGFKTRVYYEGTPHEVRIESSVVGDSICMRTDDEFNIHTGPDFKELFNEQLQDNPDIIKAEIDISRVTFIDSCALGVLITGHRALRNRSPESIYRVKVGSENLRRIFELTSLDKIIEVVVESPADTEVQ